MTIDLFLRSIPVLAPIGRAIARRRQRQEEAAIAAALARQEGMFDGLLAELRAADPREEPCTAGTAPADDRIALRRAA